MRLRLLVLSSTLFASAPALAADEGKRVHIHLNAQTELPDPEGIVSSLEQEGGEHLVQVRRQETEGGKDLTVDLWGPSLAAAEIPNTLRRAFPVLAPATIDVSTLDASQKPKPPSSDEDAPADAKGKRVKVIKKITVEK